MAKPVVLAVDDDPEVLRAVERDLRRGLGSGYRIMAVDSGSAALETAEQLRERRTPVALVLADQRMPGMTGVELLARMRQEEPAAKRVLLTAYADTDAAIRAINEVRLDHYLTKPWDPPEREMLPVLSDLLESWQEAFRPPFEGLRVVGHRWSPASHELRDFLVRNHVPYEWLDLETHPEAPAIAGDDPDPERLPIVVLGDGTRLEAPSPGEVAERIGMQARPAARYYDLVVIGGGPSGLAAAVYGASEGLSTALIERDAPGGQAGMSSRIENYLGFPSGLSGSDLARRAVAQARRFGAELLAPQEVTGLRLAGPSRVVTLADGTEIDGRAVLISTGVSYRRLEAPGAERLTGAGVYYGAAMVEADSCKNEDVYIVGGANSAGQAAMFFAAYAGTVTLLVRGPSLAKEMSHYLIDEIERTDNIRVRTHTEVAEAKGEERLEAVVLRDNSTGALDERPAAGLFVFIGAAPRTEWLAEAVARDERGFILAGPDVPRGRRVPFGWTLEREPFLMETSLPGVFVAGDVRHGSVKRVAAGVGEGAIAVSLVHRYLNAT